MTPFLPCQLALDPKLPPLSHLRPFCAPEETTDDFVIAYSLSYEHE